MKGFKQCEKGHFYKEELNTCPYCPKSPGQGGPSNPDNDKTQLFGKVSSDFTEDKTKLTGQEGSGQSSQGQAFQGRDLGKTYIQGMDMGEGEETAVTARPTRKITGWIISYALDPMGLDFRIFEGNNSLGRDTTNTIIINQNTVSGRHATILCRNNKFYVRDEMSANGMYLNGQELDINIVYDLQDGDEIKLGKDDSVVFRFKSAL